MKGFLFITTIFYQMAIYYKNILADGNKASWVKGIFLQWTASLVFPKLMSPSYIAQSVLSCENFRNWYSSVILYNGWLISLIVEKAMAPHSSTLAWRIPWMEEPGRLQSMLKVGHDWATSLSLFPFMHWRRKWQPTPAFLPGESQGRGTLVGCSLWRHTESDMTEVT